MTGDIIIEHIRQVSGMAAAPQPTAIHLSLSYIFLTVFSIFLWVKNYLLINKNNIFFDN